jgi:hypothetical protein
LAKRKNNKKDTFKGDPNDLNRQLPKYYVQVLEFAMPIPPSKNHAYFYKGGKKILKKSTKEFIETTRSKLKKEMKEQKWKHDKPHVWYYADLYFYMPDKRVRDSHNSIEVLMDTLEGILFPNDYYVMPRVMDVKLDRENPRLEVKFYAKQK